MNLDSSIWRELLKSPWSIGKELPVGSFDHHRPIHILKKMSCVNRQIEPILVAGNVNSGVHLQRMERDQLSSSSLKPSPVPKTHVTLWAPNFTRAKLTNSSKLFESLLRSKKRTLRNTLSMYCSLRAGMTN